MVSLLDGISAANGQSAANFLKGGRHLLKVSRVSHKDATPLDPKAQSQIDGTILASSNPKHQMEVGTTGRMNLNYRFPEQDLARFRRALAATATSKLGRVVPETEAASKAKEFVGPEQPLVGAVIVVVGIEAPQKGDPTKLFTKYEVEVPTEADLSSIRL